MLNQWRRHPSRQDAAGRCRQADRQGAGQGDSRRQRSVEPAQVDAELCVAAGAGARAVPAAAEPGDRGQHQEQDRHLPERADGEQAWRGKGRGLGLLGACISIKREINTYQNGGELCGVPGGQGDDWGGIDIKSKIKPTRARTHLQPPPPPTPAMPAPAVYHQLIQSAILPQNPSCPW